MLISAAGNDVQFVEFCSAIGLGDLPKSEKYSTNPERVKNRQDLIEILNSRLKERTNSDWDNAFREAGVRFPYGPVNKLAEVFSDPQVLHNGMLRQDLLHDTLGPIRYGHHRHFILVFIYFLVLFRFFKQLFSLHGQAIK